ncbi:MAG: hypothetical protein ACRCZU_13270 [Selenomonadaceae bacterium]
MDTIKVLRDLQGSCCIMGQNVRADALEEAIKALENQPKYEKALELSVRDGDKCGVDIYCDQWPCAYDDSECLEHCCECGIKYYKQQAGLEVSS